MIIVNNEQLDLSKGTSPKEKSVIKSIKEIAEKGDLVVIKDPKPYQYDDRHRKLRKAPIAFKLTTQKVNENGVTEIWTYSTKTRKDRRSGKIEHIPSHYIISGEDYLDPTKAGEPERIFFLTQVMDVEKFGLIVEDKERDAQKQLDAEEEEATVAMYIKSQRSPLSVEQLRLLALSWGMNGADEMTENLLRVDFFKRVMDSNKKKLDTGRGYKEFLRDVDNLLKDDEEEIKLRATVELAVKNKVVVWDEKRLKMLWGGTDRVICAIPPSKITSKKDFLFQHFNTHKNDKESLYISVEGVSDSFPITQLDDLKKIGNLPKMKAKIKELFGIEVPPNANKEETLQMVEEKIKSL